MWSSAAIAACLLMVAYVIIVSGCVISKDANQKKAGAKSKSTTKEKEACKEKEPTVENGTIDNRAVAAEMQKIRRRHREHRSKRDKCLASERAPPTEGGAPREKPLSFKKRIPATAECRKKKEEQQRTVSAGRATEIEPMEMQQPKKCGEKKEQENMENKDGQGCCGYGWCCAHGKKHRRATSEPSNEE